MTDLATTQSFAYDFFRGRNTRDDENSLIYGQTPSAQNFEITKQFGLAKKLGWTDKFPEYGIDTRLENHFNYSDQDGTNYYITASYPEMKLVNSENGFHTVIDTTLTSDGDPFFFELTHGEGIFVDGVNNPKLITNGVAADIPWPPTFNVENNTLLDESNNATQANPTTLGTDIGYPKFGAFYQNRAVLSGDSLRPYRLYFSKFFDYDDFGSNNSGNINIAFWLDLDARSPITSIHTVNNEYLIVLCEREIHVVTGIFPPGNGYPTPKIQMKCLNREVGCPHHRLVAPKGDNDIFFVSNFGTVYHFLSTENFQDVKPRGISSKIFPDFESVTLEQFKRGRLVNHFIKGELHLWLPSAPSKSFPDKKHVYDYADSNEDEEWGLDVGFGDDFHFVDSFVDRATNEMLIVSRNKIYQTNSGFDYDGEPIDMWYQLSPLDFGNLDNNKDIKKIIIYYSNPSDTEGLLEFYHMWEDDRSGYDRLTIFTTGQSLFGSAVYGTSKYSSFAGQPLKRIEFTPTNNIGKILKCRVRSNDAASPFIHKIVFRYLPMGKQ